MIDKFYSLLDEIRKDPRDSEYPDNPEYNWQLPNGWAVIAAIKILKEISKDITPASVYTLDSGTLIVEWHSTNWNEWKLEDEYNPRSSILIALSDKIFITAVGVRGQFSKEDVSLEDTIEIVTQYLDFKDFKQPQSCV